MDEAKPVEVPEFLAHLPRQGALLVPWFVWRDDAGRYRFRVRDPKRNTESVRHGLCFICGKRMHSPFTFMVGPLTLSARSVYGGPLHARCGEVAMKLCPFLAHQDWQRAEVPAERQIVPHDELPPKPDRLALATVKRYRELAGPHNQAYAAFSEPLEVRWWVYRDGALAPEKP